MKLLNGKPVVRCSSLDQLISCPASRTLNAKLGEVEVDDSASWEGQWCHYQAAMRFVQKHGAMPPEGGLPAPRIPKDFKPDSFAEWIVDYYHRAVMEETPGDWAMEVEAELLYEFPNFWLSGHCDVSAVAPDVSALNFDDLKSGSNVVDAAECNWQVLGYAALFKMAYTPLRRIRGRIVQPRVREGEGQRISAVIIDERGIWNDVGELISAATIETFVALLVGSVDAALKDSMTLDTGIKQCRWCLAGELLQCPALNEEKETMKMTLTQAALDAVKAQPDAATLVKWGVAKKLLEPKLKKAWELLKEHAEKSGEFTTEDGVKVLLKDWNGAREFTAEGKPKAWEEIAESLPEDLAYACMDLSPAAIEKAFAKSLGLPVESKKGDSGEAQFNNRFGTLITRKTGKQLTLVA